MKLFKTFAITFVCFLFCSSTANGQVTVSPWEIHKGSQGVIDFVTAFHGDPAAYSKMKIPVDTDEGWKPAPTKDGKVHVSEHSSLTCNKQLDFTYFQAEVSIPQNTRVDKFTVSYDKADDGARIYFFNSKHPNGHFNAEADLRLSGKPVGSVNLKDQVIAGEVNRVVIVQFDDCGTGNNISGIHIKVNGKEVKQSSNVITDADGNKYPITKIGNQFWMTENLKTTKCQDGTPITKVATNGADIQTPGMYWHDNDPNSTNSQKHGPVYNWAAIQQCNICPSGWRIPTQEEWMKVLRFWYSEVGEGAVGLTHAGYQLRDNAANMWPNNSKDTNSTNFSGRPGGWLSRGKFSYFGSRVAWWGSGAKGKTTPMFTKLASGKDGTWSGAASTADKMYVRCIKITTVPAIPTNFKLHAYSTHGNRGGEGDYWMGWYKNNEPAWGKIITHGSTDFEYMNIEKVAVSGESDVVYLKVKNYSTADSYLTYSPSDKKIKITQGTSDNAKFRVKSPLQSIAANSNYVSFESVAKPNFYIRHAGYKLFLHEATPANLKNKVFIEDASWLFQKL